VTALPLCVKKIKLSCNNLSRSIRLWNVEAPHFLDNRLTDGSEVSLAPAARPLPPRRFLVLSFVRGWVDPRATVRREGLLTSIEKSNYLMGNRNRDLSACSTVPQETTLPCAPGNCITIQLIAWIRIFEKLLGAQLVSRFSALDGTGRFITAFTKNHQLLPRVR
jgi:hypothetical protein